MIKVTNLTKKYGSSCVLDNINFDLDKSGVVALVGNNGAGKTTLFKLLMHDIKPTSGSISILGSDANRVIVDNVHLMDEQNNYFDWRLKKIIETHAEFDMRFDTAKCKKILELFKLDDKKFFHRLSKGMHNQFNIAIALASAKKIVLMDEPSSGLDEMSRCNFYKLIADESLSGERLIIISTHMLEELGELADKIMLLYDNGKMHCLDSSEFGVKFVRLVGTRASLEDMLLSRWRTDVKTLGDNMSCIIVNDLSYIDKKNIKTNNIAISAIATHEACRILSNDEMFKVAYETDN